MLNIDEISDYRDLLKNYYVQKKLDMPLYSYKMLGQKLELDTSHVFRILNKVHHLPNRCIPLAKEMLGLKGRSAELFEILVAASKTKSKAKKEKYYNMALALQDVKLHQMNSNELLFLSKWWIPVVRALIEIKGKTVPVQQLIKNIRPAITQEQSDEAMTVLKELKMITPLASEKYAASQANFTSAGAAKVAAIRSYQKQLLGLAQDALDSVDPAERNITSLMVSVDDETFSDLKDMTLEFRRQVQKRVEEVKNPTRVMQFAFALYPVADIPNEKNVDASTKKGGKK